MAIFISVTMVLSIVGFVGIGALHGATNQNYESSYETISYNGFTFYDLGYQKLLSFGDQGLEQGYSFQYLPQELEYITFNTDLSEVFLSEKIYLAYDPSDNESTQEQLNLLAGTLTNFGKRTQDACTHEEACPDIPIIDCEQDTGLILSYAEELEVGKQGSCVLLEGSSEEEIVQLRERFTYAFLGVMT